MSAGAGVRRPLPRCICCGRSTSGGMLCDKCALPDPERVKELRQSGETSAQRRRRWMVEARGS